MASLLSSAQAIASITDSLFIYGGFTLLVLGLLGNGLNILILTILPVFQNNPCAFCLFVESIGNFGQMLTELLAYSLLIGAKVDASRNAPAWCKVKSVAEQIFNLISFGTICLAAFDQFLSTNPRCHWRRLSTLKFIRSLIGIFLVVTLLHSIPFLIFFGIDLSRGCVIGNARLEVYYSFFYYPLLIGLLPIVVTTTFAFLAFHNVRHLVRRDVALGRRRLDRQLTAMIFTRVLCFVILTLPYVIFRIYALNVKLSALNLLSLAVLRLVGTSLGLLFFVNYVVNEARRNLCRRTSFFRFQISFYVFCLSSTRFRRQVKSVVFKRCWRRWCAKRNQVGLSPAARHPTPSALVEREPSNASHQSNELVLQN